MSQSSAFDLKTAQRLYTAAVAVGMRPVDALVEQASHERCANWAVLAAHSIVPGIEVILKSAPLEELDRIRLIGKGGFHEARSFKERNASLLVYAISIAAALDRFGALLTSQSHEELDIVLAGVARCVPPEWSELLDRAIVRHARVRAEMEQQGPALQ